MRRRLGLGYRSETSLLRVLKRGPYAPNTRTRAQLALGPRTGRKQNRRKLTVARLHNPQLCSFWVAPYARITFPMYARVSGSGTLAARP